MHLQSSYSAEQRFVLSVKQNAYDLAVVFKASTHTFHGACHILILVGLFSEVCTFQHVATLPSVQGCHVQLLLKEP